MYHTTFVPVYHIMCCNHQKEGIPYVIESKNMKKKIKINFCGDNKHLEYLDEIHKQFIFK